MGALLRPPALSLVLDQLCAQTPAAPGRAGLGRAGLGWAACLPSQQDGARPALSFLPSACGVHWNRKSRWASETRMTPWRRCQLGCGRGLILVSDRNGAAL